MLKSDLLKAVEHQPKSMGCCTECKGKKKDCEPNPMSCMDFRIFNYGKLKELGLVE